MDKRWKWETHNGTELLVHDYTNMHADELLAALLENGKAVQTFGRSDIRLLIKVEGSKANKELISRWKIEAKRDRHLYKRIAVTGLTGLTATFLWAINTFSGAGAKPFDDDKTAKDWLATE